MKDTSGKAAETLKAATHGANATMSAQTEPAIAQAKATFEQMATKSREAMQQGLKTVDGITGMASDNVDALLEASRLAAGGFQAIAVEVAEFSKASLERTTSAAHALTMAKTAPELMQLQSEFARTQFNVAVGEVSKLSETMFRLMTDIFEPLQKQAVSSAQIRDLMTDD